MLLAVQPEHSTGPARQKGLKCARALPFLAVLAVLAGTLVTTTTTIAAGAGHARRRHDHARHPRFVRGLEGCARRLHEADGHQGQGAPCGRRRCRAEPGDPHEGRPDRRPALRRRQHVPVPRAVAQDIFQPYTSPDALVGPDGVPARRERTASRRSTTPTSASTTTRSGSRTTTSRSRPSSRTSRSPRTRVSSSVENPSTSSPGLAFQLATIAHFGTKGWRDYWSKLRANDVEVVNGWEAGVQRRVQRPARANGSKPLVVSYASDPAAAVYFASDPKPTVSPVGTLARELLPPDRVRRRPEGDGARARRPGSSSTSCCRSGSRPTCRCRCSCYPVRDGTPLPEVFRKFADVPANVLTLPADGDRQGP